VTDCSSASFERSLWPLDSPRHGALPPEQQAPVNLATLIKEMTSSTVQFCEGSDRKRRPAFDAKGRCGEAEVVLR
jgi:hypothetical protein